MAVHVCPIQANKILPSAVINDFQRLDILVNNAAWNIGIPFRDLCSLTAEIWETNLRGPYLLSRVFAPEPELGRVEQLTSSWSLRLCLPAPTNTHCIGSNRFSGRCACLGSELAYRA